MNETYPCPMTACTMGVCERSTNTWVEFRRPCGHEIRQCPMCSGHGEKMMGQYAPEASTCSCGETNHVFVVAIGTPDDYRPTEKWPVTERDREFRGITIQAPGE